MNSLVKTLRSCHAHGVILLRLCIAAKCLELMPSMVWRFFSPWIQALVARWSTGEATKPVSWTWPNLHWNTCQPLALVSTASVCYLLPLMWLTRKEMVTYIGANPVCAPVLEHPLTMLSTHWPIGMADQIKKKKKRVPAEAENSPSHIETLH